ncbi:hypothetical protein PBRA_009712 [Plasmodiophora brassicae]|uniref:Uncharacterized protein n=1 Tax=Plasmodiophora brassicae TaxID=37360 RepID=A0A0G4ILX7_PLABS|nr:hypothetical protein PBRA_009712 [Plasmodiophora brassicae]
MSPAVLIFPAKRILRKGINATLHVEWQRQLASEALRRQRTCCKTPLLLATTTAYTSTGRQQMLRAWLLLLFSSRCGSLETNKPGEVSPFQGRPAATNRDSRRRSRRLGRYPCIA